MVATAVPWVSWLWAGYLSHRRHPPGVPIAILGVLGLLAPMVVAGVLIARDPVLVKDTLHRLVNFRAVNGWYVVLACVLMPATLLVAGPADRSRHQGDPDRDRRTPGCCGGLGLSLIHI